MKHTFNLILSIFLLGFVDRIEEQMVSAEITNKSDTGEYENINIDLPLILFPCDIEEGGMFYFEYADGITEIRCGEPNP
jgi:hypothetical protein